MKEPTGLQWFIALAISFGGAYGLVWLLIWLVARPWTDEYKRARDLARRCNQALGLDD